MKTAVRGPVVQVRVVPGVGGMDVEFASAQRGRVRRLRLRLTDPGVVERARVELGRGLRELKDSTEALTVEDEFLPELARTLGRLGSRLILLLFSNRPAVIRGLQDFWNAAVPAWRNPGCLAVIECVGDADRILPLEFLPLFDMAAFADEITDREQFLRGCRAFVGFSCVVRRRLLEAPIRGNSRLLPDGTADLVVRYLHHESLEGAKREFEWFEANRGRALAVHGPYPHADHTAADIADMVFDPADDHVQHFACHCDTTPSDPLDYRLELYGEGRDLEVALGELGGRLVQLAAGRDRGRREMPLVVINACGSSRIHPSSSISFPRLFMQNGNRGCVGTEVEIHDDVAAVFSAVFYRELLDGADIGSAAHRARTHLLHTHNNPSGLAYSLYGDTDLAIHTTKGHH